MSVYNPVADDDIDIDETVREVTIYAGDNDSGSLYIYLTFAQIESIYQRITKEVGGE